MFFMPLVQVSNAILGYYISRAATNTTAIIATSGKRNGVKMKMCTGGGKKLFLCLWCKFRMRINYCYY